MKLPNLTAEFRAARPFPHMIIDDLFDRSLTTAAAAEVPRAKDRRWTARRNKVDSKLPPKLGIDNLKRFRTLARIVKAMTSPEFVDWLRETSGIENLIADTTLAGAGLHGVQPGGLLGMHVDFDRLGPLYRRLNAFVYLNPEWEIGWGGALELRGQGHPSVIIPPVLGRFVAFETSERSWHGHPYPLECPKNRLRASLAVYYYTAERPDWFIEDHSTIYKDMP